MPVTNNLSAHLKTMTALLGGNRNALGFASPFSRSYKDTQNALIGRNIVAKAAQLVTDIENAKTAKAQFQSFLAEQSPPAKTPQSPRGGNLNITS